MNWLPVAGWSLVGGVILEAIHWYGLKENPLFPTYARQLKYWIVTAAVIVLGAVVSVAIVLSGDSASAITPLNALALGFSFPSVAHKLGKFLPDQVTAGLDETSSPLPHVKHFLVS